MTLASVSFDMLMRPDIAPVICTAVRIFTLMATPPGWFECVFKRVFKLQVQEATSLASKLEKRVS